MPHKKDAIVTYADYANGAITAVTVGTSSTAASAALIPAGTAVLRVVASDGMNILIGTTSLGAATTAHYRIPANTPCYLGLDADRGMDKYRVISDSAAQTLYLSIVA